MSTVKKAFPVVPKTTGNYVKGRYNFMNEFIVVIYDKLFCKTEYIPEKADNAREAAKQAYNRTDYTYCGRKCDVIAVYKKTSFKMPVYGFKNK